MNKGTIITLAIIAIVLAIIPFGFYKYYFNGSIVAQNDAWGQFGNFIGGVLNPFIALFSFIALLFNLDYQSKKIHKNDKIRKRDEIINSIQLLEKTVEPKMEMILSRQYTLPEKEKYNYQMAISLSNDLKIVYNFLVDISNYAQSESIVGIYKYKYLDISKILFNKNYISKELYDYFKTAEE